MPHAELLALIGEAYRFAGVPDPDRLAAAFAARRGAAPERAHEAGSKP
jgi:hypothetical protein